MDDLTDLWLVNTQNMDTSDLDLLLDNLETIEGIDTEGILYMTQANFDAFNSIGDELLAAWDAEPGHHVEFVSPVDFDFDGDVDGADFLAWQLNDGSQSGLDIWQEQFGDVASAMTTASTGVPEPSTMLMLAVGLVGLTVARRKR